MNYSHELYSHELYSHELYSHELYSHELLHPSLGQVLTWNIIMEDYIDV